MTNKQRHLLRNMLFSWLLLVAFVPQVAIKALHVCHNTNVHHLSEKHQQQAHYAPAASTCAICAFQLSPSTPALPPLFKSVLWVLVAAVFTVYLLKPTVNTHVLRHLRAPPHF